MSDVFDENDMEQDVIIDIKKANGVYAMLDDVDRNATTCIVSWCGNKCDLYQKDMAGINNYVLISSLESRGYCPYRKSAVYVI